MWTLSLRLFVGLYEGIALIVAWSRLSCSGVNGQAHRPDGLHCIPFGLSVVENRRREHGGGDNDAHSQEFAVFHTFGSVAGAGDEALGVLQRLPVLGKQPDRGRLRPSWPSALPVMPKESAGKTRRTQTGQLLLKQKASSPASKYPRRR